MTKKLEELLNLPESQEIVQEEQAKSEAQDKQQEQKAKGKRRSKSSRSQDPGLREVHVLHLHRQSGHIDR